jgi:branched-chain amino acid transport system substrate-binding protein
MKRKKWILAITAVFFLISTMGGSAAAMDEIRIGTIGPITGWATIFGQGCLDGINLALDEYNYEFNGVPIKVISEDTKADVEVMRTKLDSLKTRDNVHLIIGPSLGHEGMAAVDWGARNPEVPMLVGYSAPEDITMRKATNSVVRPGWTGAR